jgi:hypothetical protein
VYVLMGVVGAFALQYVPRALVVPGDAAATAERIRISEVLLRAGIAAELISTVLFVFTALLLYRLFKSVDQGMASLMVIFVLLSAPISLLNVLNEVAASALVGGGDQLSALAGPQRDALAYVFMRLHGQGFAVAEIFWGLWLIPLGLLAMRSGFVPRVVGVLLIAAGSGYLAHSFTALVVPQYASLVANVALIPELGELSIVVWLLATRWRGTPFAQVSIAAPKAAVTGAPG